MAEVIAREIAVQFFDSKPYFAEPKLLPPDRGPAPAPEPPLPVARHYRALIDDHADHPGTGLGRRARLRIKEAA
jgi:DNA (cytosine-5)-methyltransferase 1